MGLCASKSDKETPARVSNPTTVRTKPVSKPSKTVQSKPVRLNDGQKINDEIDENKNQLSAKDAARLAAEKRLQDNNAKSTRGALGKKLAEERSKSHKSHMMETVEKRQLDQANNDLTYD